jgi:hypothetical protein
LADFHSVKSLFDSKSLSYFTFSPKSDKPIKAVIRHLPLNTHAEDISDGLVEIGFDVVSVKQMTTIRRSSPEDPKITNPFLFLITLPKTAKSQEIFRLPSICHITIKVEVYRAQNCLTQCHNCQQFGHVWANCKQPPRCLWCGGGHLHKDCPENDNASFTPACCNCKLAEGEKSHTANYRGCSHAKDELQRKRTQKPPRPQEGECSSPLSPLQACHSLQHSEVANSSNSSSQHLRHRPQPRAEFLGHFNTATNRSVSPGL